MKKRPKITAAQERALNEMYDRLEGAFQKALARGQKPGHARNWMMPYCEQVLRGYNEARRCVVDGVRLTSLIGRTKRSILGELLRRTCNRDVKTRSRWAAMLANAARAKINRADLAQWLAKGGGIAGRSQSRPNVTS